MAYSRFSLLLPGLLLAVAVSLAAQTAAPEREIPVENDIVRVVQVFRAEPHRKTREHKHDMNRVMLYLNAGSQTTTYTGAGGGSGGSSSTTTGISKVEKIVWRPGEAIWSPAAGLHIAEITSAEPARIVEIELRNVPGNAAMSWPGRDPVKGDSRHFRLDFDNAQVRVVRMRLGAGESTPMLDHVGPRIVTTLTAQQLEIGRPAGAAAETRARAAEKVEWFAESSRESWRNRGTSPAEAVIVYLKR